MRAKDKTATEVDLSGKRQRKLAAGVLKQATRDLRRFRGAAKPGENCISTPIAGSPPMNSPGRFPFSMSATR